ncbi:hypothetical protein [Pseudorhodoferax sp.]|uniref:hypothetical protein n=1 Tax=Pseudorhodoferax sp. TaxID=1993553 RepID=UPI002DD6958C|nr:hypothetical protein [Pseudorhodoferax sp.]
MQYIQPASDEPSAILNGYGYFINVSNSNGRYAGRTHVDKPGYRIHANRPILITVEAFMRGDEFCRASTTFVPEANQEYKVIASFTRKFRENAIIPVSTGVCSLNVEKI